MAPEKHPDALRTIGEVAEELDIATHVLRFWESKFHQIKPQKRRGRRYYRPEDIKVITQIKSLLYNQGYTIRGVQKFLSQKPSKTISNDESSLPNRDVPVFNRDLFGNVIKEDALESVEADNDRQLSDEERQHLTDVLSGLKKMRERLVSAA